jgi:Protein of unknown function (DUF3892)
VGSHIAEVISARRRCTARLHDANGRNSRASKGSPALSQLRTSVAATKSASTAPATGPQATPTRNGQHRRDRDERSMLVAIRITAIRLAGGTTHEHVERLWWTDPATGETGEGTPSEILSLIEDHNDDAYVEQDGERISLWAVEPASGPKYVRTCDNGGWTDHLLSLPQF